MTRYYVWRASSNTQRFLLNEVRGGGVAAVSYTSHSVLSIVRATQWHWGINSLPEVMAADWGTCSMRWKLGRSTVVMLYRKDLVCVVVMVGIKVSFY